MSRRNQAAASSTPDSSATLQVPSSMTQEQNEQILELMRRKLEREMAAVDAEAELKRELMKKESDARIAASAASASAASAATAAAPQRRTMSEEDDILGSGAYWD